LCVPITCPLDASLSLSIGLNEPYDYKPYIYPPTPEGLDDLDWLDKGYNGGKKG